MIKRQAVSKLKELAEGFPVVSVTGPRQSGKTTLVRQAFADYQYLTLEDVDVRTEASEDPRGFLRRLSVDGFILDEVQHVPALFSYLQGMADQAKEMGRMVLTGSQNFLLSEKISQTLAGRVGWIELLPFRYQELQQYLKGESVEHCLFQGLFPPLYDRKLAAEDWYPRYVQTYIDRDVRLIKNIGNLSLFQKFIKLCAGRVGQLLNFSNLALECGIDTKTAQSWISLLEASYVIVLLKPHHRNFNKRLVKQSKLYFLDTGVACALLGIEKAEQLTTHPSRGALFENYIILDFLKKRFNEGKPSNLYFWRDHAGHEIDLLLEEVDGLRPIEIKSSETITDEMSKHLRYFMNLAEGNEPEGEVIYGGERFGVRQGVSFRSWRRL